MNNVTHKIITLFFLFVFLGFSQTEHAAALCCSGPTGVVNTSNATCADGFTPVGAIMCGNGTLQNTTETTNTPTQTTVCCQKGNSYTYKTESSCRASFGSTVGDVFCGGKAPERPNTTTVKTNFNDSSSGTTNQNSQSPKNSLITGKQIPSDLGNYIKMIYVYGMGIVGIVATIVIMIGGFVWLSSLGNASRINDAKEWIGAALSGLALALFSYTILWIINPDLVNLKPLDLKKVTPSGIATPSESSTSGCCTASCSVTTISACPSGFHQGKSCAGLAACDRSVDISIYDPKHLKREEYCGQLSESECKDCLECVSMKGVEIQNGKGQYIDYKLAQRIQDSNLSITRALGKGIVITEGYPPTGGHVPNSCHSRGECIDMKPKNYDKSNPNYDELKTIYDITKARGTPPTWEIAGNGRTKEQQDKELKSCQDKGITCTINTSATGDHFHWTKK